LNAQQASEEAHWPSFWKVSIEYLYAKYPKPYDEGAKHLISFLFGIISHGVADVLWHSLNMEQGFIDAMNKLNFGNNYKEAHGVADIGGDLLLTRLANLDYASIWKVPTKDLVQIYDLMNIKVTEVQINSCMAAGYALLVVEKAYGKYLFPNFAEKSPFLVDNYFSYYRGGIQSIAIAVSECWNKGMAWIESGEIDSECAHMGTYYSIGKRSITPELDAIKSCLMNWTEFVEQTLFSDHTLISKREIPDVMLNYCIMSTISPKSNLDKPNFIFESIYNFGLDGMNYFRNIFTSKKCATPISTVIVASIDYMKLGTSMVTGDFDGSGRKHLVIGAPGCSSGRFIQDGCVFLIDNGIDRNSKRVQIDESSTIITGSDENGAGFGHDLAVVDLNMDGIDDLAISAPYSGASNERQQGKVFILFGRKDIGLNSDVGFDLVIDGAEIENQDPLMFGSKLQSIDLDNDGFIDLVVCSPMMTVDQKPQTGSIHAFYANSNHIGSISFKDADWFLSGIIPYQNFGHSISKFESNLFIGSSGLEREPELMFAGAVEKYGIDSSKSAPVKLLQLPGTQKFGGFGKNIVIPSASQIIISSSTETSLFARPHAMNLPGLLVKENGYQGGVVRIFKKLDDRVSEIEYHGSSSLGRLGASIVDLGVKGILLSEPLSYGGFRFLT
jgi:glycosylphosphatidylinositol phospholipase D